MENKHTSTPCSPSSDSEIETLMDRLQDLSQTVLQLQEVILNLSEKALTELAVDTEEKTQKTAENTRSEDRKTQKTSIPKYQDVLSAEEIALLTPQRILH